MLIAHAVQVVTSEPAAEHHAHPIASRRHLHLIEAGPRTRVSRGRRLASDNHRTLASRPNPATSLPLLRGLARAVTRHPPSRTAPPRAVHTRTARTSLRRDWRLALGTGAHAPSLPISVTRCWRMAREQPD